MNSYYFDKTVREIQREGLDAMLIAPSGDLAFPCALQQKEMCGFYPAL